MAGLLPRFAYIRPSLWSGDAARDRGYQGSCRQVRGYLARFRGNAAAPPPVPPKVRAVTGWIMTRPDRLADADRVSLDAILAASADLAAVAASVRAFASKMNERRGPQAARTVDDRRPRHRRARAPQCARARLQFRRQLRATD